MSIRKLLITAFFAVGAIIAPASAQNINAAYSQEQAAERIEAAKNRLNLTDEQAPRVEAILRESAEKRRAVLEKYGVGGDNRLSFREKRSLRGELESIRQETKSALGGVLTDDQLAEFGKIQEEQRQALRAKLQERKSR